MDGMQGSESEEGRSLPVPDPKPKRNRERHKAWSFEDTFQISCCERTQDDGPGYLQQNISFTKLRGWGGKAAAWKGGPGAAAVAQPPGAALDPDICTLAFGPAALVSVFIRFRAVRGYGQVMYD